MRKILILFVFVFCFFNLQAQNYTISGFVTDKNTGEMLIGAIVYINKNNAETTNEYGYYSLNINNSDSDFITIKVRMIGYNELTKRINIKKERIHNFYLEFNNSMDSIIVFGRITINKNTEIGTVEIPINQLNVLPAIGSESDIFKALQLMPGIQSGREGSSNLIVRGGAPDENLVLLVDVPLYNVSHLAGFISVFNTDALKSAKMIKGGFPARYSGRLSSILDIRMKDGNMHSYHGKFTIGLLNTKLFYEGPIIKNKASFIVSARILPLSLLTKPFFLLANDGQMLGYNFHDINLKFNYIINSKNHLFLSFYTGDDRLSINSSNLYNSYEKINYHLVWGNKLASLRWNHIFNQKIFLNTNISFTRFRNNNILYSSNNQALDLFNLEIRNSITDIIYKSVFDFSLNRNYKIKIAYNSVCHVFNPVYSYYKIIESDTIKKEIENNTNLEYAFENRIFIENTFKISNFFKANIGASFSDYYIDRKHYPSVEPRIILNVMFLDNYSVKFSYSQMQQFVHILSSNSIGLTPDIWISSNSQISPSESKQFSFGLFKYIEKKDIELSVISYYKILNNLITYKEGAVYIGNAQNWQDKIETNGIGISYGLEFLLQKNQGKTTGWISYTYAKTSRRFQNINNGEEFPFKYDRRNDFSIVLSRKISKNINIACDWIFGSGYPYTMPISVFNTIDDGTLSNPEESEFNSNQIAFIYADRNSFRMRAYHRLDLSANFSKKVKKGIRTWNISIYNAYNRQNPYFYYTKFDKKDNKFKMFQQSLFPIIPSVSYSLKF